MFDKRMLFTPDHGAKESETFSVPIGGQVTVAAFGLSGGDTVTFEMVLTPAMKADVCKCPPFKVELPSVGSAEPLRCCTGPVTISATNPYAIIDAPQNIGLRAILNTQDPSGIHVWVFESNTRNVTERMRGCPCGE